MRISDSKGVVQKREGHTTRQLPTLTNEKHIPDFVHAFNDEYVS